MWRFLEYHSLPSDASSDNYLKGTAYLQLNNFKSRTQELF